MGELCQSRISSSSGNLQGVGGEVDGMIQNATSMSTLATKANLSRGWGRPIASYRSSYDKDERTSGMFKVTELPHLGKERSWMRWNWFVTFFGTRPRWENMKL